ncbi:ATP-binding protein [Nitrospira sp. Kam-Ns4a]
MGETRVDLLHLLEDLRDAYAGPIEETILTEIIANSLDSGASHIAVTADPAQATVTVVDNGTGMQRRELARYHDVAASTKTRGQGIGFAGVGIKLGLLVCAEVLTETRRGQTHVASCWHLASRHRAPWRWVPPPGLVPTRGTAVRLTLHNALSPLLDPGFIETAIRKHFQPLLDPAVEPLLAGAYPHGVTIEVNGTPLDRQGWAAAERAVLEIRLARKRKPSALGYLIRDSLPLPEERRGLAVSTYGKIIKRGWDWLGLTPSAPERIGGLIEAPALAACLTLNKGDFIRSGQRGALYLAYRKAFQEAVARQLHAWGDMREPAEEARQRAVRPLERDLGRVLEDLAQDFPLLAALIEPRAGGQKRLPIGGRESGAEPICLSGLAPVEPEPPARPAQPEPPREPDGQPGEPTEPSREQAPPSGVRLPDGRGAKRPARYGLTIQFEERPGDPELARLVESTVWINQAHPAYQRALASRSVGYHISLAVALALAPLAVEPAKEHAFVTTFLARWGEAVGGSRGSGKRAR